MDWQEVVSNPNLQDLPFKIELNERGEIIMNAVKLNHSAFQTEIILLMGAERKDGRIMTECAIWTKKGTKSADVAWFASSSWKKVKGKTESPFAPEVCVEVLSISNTDREMKEKRKLYFEQGAKEVWICDEYGDVSFYSSKRKLKQSALFPNFPTKIEI